MKEMEANMAKIDADIATIRADMANMVGRMDRLTTYMEKYTGKGDRWREDTGQKLAVIINNQEEFKKYQDSCDRDRQEIRGDISDLQNYRSRNTGIAVTISAVISGAVAVAGLFLGRN